MRTISYSEWKKKRATGLSSRARLGLSRQASKRPRDERERSLISEIDRARFLRLQDSGRLVRTSPRHYKIDTSISV